MIKVYTPEGFFEVDSELAPCPVCGKTPDVFVSYDYYTDGYLAGIACYDEDGISHARTNTEGATQKTAVLHTVNKWNHGGMKIFKKEDKGNE